MKINSRRAVSLLKRLGKSLGAEKFLLNADVSLGLLKHSVAHILPGIIQPEPRNLTIAITAYCNLRCIGCRYGRDFMPGAHLSWQLLSDLLDDANRGASSLCVSTAESHFFIRIFQKLRLVRWVLVCLPT